MSLKKNKYIKSRNRHCNVSIPALYTMVSKPNTSVFGYEITSSYTNWAQHEYKITYVINMHKCLVHL